MVAEFRGSPPHDLGTAVLALARALGENIEISYVSREPGQIVLDFKRI